MVACGVVDCGVDFSVEVDGLFEVAYGVVVCGVDLMWRKVVCLW